MSGEITNLNPAPDEGVINEPSIVDEVPQPEEEVGAETEQLSELSDIEDLAHASKASRSSLSTWWAKRISPLMRNKKVQALAIVSCILTIVNLMLFLTTLYFFGRVIYLKIQVESIRKKDMPCIYEFGPWGPCSATCWDKERGAEKPYKTRFLNQATLVEQRGSNNYAKCPAGIEEGKEFEQRAPCNLQRCPKRLSTFRKFSECFYRDPQQGKKGGCYRIRILPLESQLIEIDVDNLTLPCSADECPEYLP